MRKSSVLSYLNTLKWGMKSNKKPKILSVSSVLLIFSVLYVKSNTDACMLSYYYTNDKHQRVLLVIKQNRRK